MIWSVTFKFTYTVAKFRCHPPNTSNRSYTFRPLESFPSIPEIFEIFSNTIMKDTLIIFVLHSYVYSLISLHVRRDP